MTKSRLVGIAIVLLGLLGSAALAQSIVGGVKGTVRDPASAVVPGATVILLDLEKNITRHVTSDAAGLYNFTNVPPGKYQLKVEKQGFRKWTGDLVLQVQQTAAIDPTLAVGDLASVVEVRAVTPVIATESSNVANVTESGRIRDMPLNGMDVTQLFQLTPGVESGSYSPHVAGMNPGAAEILQDGGSIVDRMRGGLPRVSLAMDNIQEFGVDTNSTAQFSHPATITMVTKSGTNGLHGSLFEKFRNNAAGLRARAREDGNTPPPYKRNEFGASAGGPVRIPGLYNGKDKTFWFFSYQGMRLREYVSAADDVPTEAMWQGDFSNLHNAAGNAYTIYDPLSTMANGTRTPFAGNKIPSTVGGNQLITFLAANTPRPTTSTDPMAGNNYYATASQPQDYNSYNFKIDHHIGDSDVLTGRFTLSNSNRYYYMGYGPVAPNMAYNYGGEVDHIYNGGITWVHTFTPTMINEFLLSGQRSVATQGGGREDVKWDTQLGLSNPLNEYGWPTLTGGAVGGGIGAFIWDSQNKMPEHLNKLIAEDNLTLVRGKHEIRLGFRYGNERNNTRVAQMAQGRYSFTGGWTSLWDPTSQQQVPFSGVGMADMFLGYGSFYKANYARPYYYLRQGELGTYVQDSWKVTPRLTLNYGMRWDYWNPYTEAANRIFAMDMTQWQTTHQLITPAGHPAESLGVPPSLLASYAAQGLTWTTADKAGFPAGLMSGDKGDFAPRIGAAYRLSDKSVVRGSYGMYYWTVPNSQMLGQANYSAPLNLSYITEPDYWGQVWPYNAFHQPIPGEKVGDPNLIDITSPQALQPPFAFVPFTKDMRNARVQQWNLTFEREIAPMTSLRLTYIGNHGSNLMQTVDVNAQEPAYLYTTRTGQLAPSDPAQLRVNPFWQDLAYREPVGYSNSNQFQVNLERRFNKGLQFQWYYVFTRDLSTSDASQGYASQPGLIAPDAVTIQNGSSLSLADRLRLVYANVAGIPKNQVNWNLIYDLPFGKGKLLGGNASKALNQVIGGWQIASLGGFHTGQWLTPTTNTDAGSWWNPNLQMLRDPRLSGSQQQVVTFQGRQQLLYFAGYFDPTGTGLTNYQPALMPPGSDGSNNVPVKLSDGSTANVGYYVHNSMPNNFIQGPSNWNVDFSLFKNFQISEARRLRITADAFNLFNHPNNINPNLTTGMIDLGRSANAPRIIQLSARFDF